MIIDSIFWESFTKHGFDNGHTSNHFAFPLEVFTAMIQAIA